MSIQEGYSYLYPIKYMRSWVTDAGANGKRNVPLEFRLHCAMCGAMGIGVNLNKCPDRDAGQMKRVIGVYKEIRGLVQSGCTAWRRWRRRRAGGAVRECG